VTRADAITTGANAAVRFGKPFRVYRLPLWPPDVYGVIAVDRLLPMEAETFDRLEPEGPRVAAAGEAQGSLF
jgi:hypothetical protein